jgi:hypothetical protein
MPWTWTVSSPTPPVGDLPAFLQSIPIAQEGHVITTDYHNMLRAALLAMVSQMGGVAPGRTASLPPSFLEYDGGPNWNVANGLATPQAGQTSAKGWLPLQLPHGARLEQMTVFGDRTGTVDSFIVQLLRVTVADMSNVALITFQLKLAPSPFKFWGTVSVGGAGPAALEEYRTIDNDNYTYLVIARANIQAAATALISALQVSYTA